MAAPTYFENKKSEVNELRILLKSVDIQKDKRKYRQVVQKVIAFMTLGIDVSSLFSNMIMASATTDLVQKKLVYLYICTHAESNAELAVLTINTLQKDANDANPMVRGLALRSMFNLRIPSLVEYMKESLLAGLDDRSGYVRKTAVLGALKLFHLAPQWITELKIIDKLHEMIRDRDQQVVVNCILALEEILASKGGLQIDSELAMYLMERLDIFDEWAQCMLMETLSRYQPTDQQEVFTYLNILDDRLRHSNKGVVMATVKLFLFYSKDLDFLKVDVCERLRVPLLTILSSSSPELVYTGLHHISVLLSRSPRLFAGDYNSFFLRGNEPAYVKHKKLEVLTDIVTEANMQQIIEELKEYVMDIDASISCRSVGCIGKIALKFPFVINLCTETLMSLLALEKDYITSQILEVIREKKRRFNFDESPCKRSGSSIYGNVYIVHIPQSNQTDGRILHTDIWSDLMLKYKEVASVILPHIPECWELVTDRPSGKAAIIWMLGEYGEMIPQSPYLLEEVIDNIEEEQSSQVKLQLLTATMKLFFKRPPECQHILGKLLEYLVEEETNMDIRDRAMFYYRLLKANVQKAKKIVLEKHSGESVENDNTRKKQKNFLFDEFNTLSVIYGQPSVRFVSQNVAARNLMETTGTDENPSVKESEDSLSDVGSRSDGSHLQMSPERCSSGSVAVGDLLGDLSVVEAIQEPIIHLSPSCKLSASEFEKQWRSLPDSCQFEESLTVVPLHDELESVMRSKSIFTMASSPSEHSTAKFYYYAKKHVLGQSNGQDTFSAQATETDFEVWILVELLVMKNERKMKVTVKCSDQEAAAVFKNFFHKIFVGKWIALLPTE